MAGVISRGPSVLRGQHGKCVDGRGGLLRALADGLAVEVIGAAADKNK